MCIYIYIENCSKYLAAVLWAESGICKQYSWSVRSHCHASKPIVYLHPVSMAKQAVPSLGLSRLTVSVVRSGRNLWAPV